MSLDNMTNYILVFIGGGIGSLLRFLVGTWIGGRWGRNFPLGTFFVNVSGSFLIGFIMTAISIRLIINPQWRLLLVVGGLGGFTTFSAFEYETGRLVMDGEIVYAVLNIILSVAAGFIALKLGDAAAKIL